MDRVRIMQEKWDYLIILDACRYDCFEQVWKNYLHGHLEKRISAGSSTKQWRDKSFPGYYDDVIYVSANPFVNSLAAVKGFTGIEHFCKVYDLWRDNWDYEKATILPETVTEQAIEIINANKNRRAIIHYIQPHEPYLSVDVSNSVLHRDRPMLRKIADEVGGSKTQVRTADKIVEMLKGVFYWIGLRGHLPFWKLRELLNMPPANHMDAVRRALGRDGVRKAYRENLDIVLKHVAELVDALTGKVVITSDHGEMLGESGCYSHWSRAKKKFLLEIPWLIVDKGTRIVEETEQGPQPEPTVGKTDSREAEKQIQERLRALGYFD